MADSTKAPRRWRLEWHESAEVEWHESAEAALPLEGPAVPVGEQIEVVEVLPSTVVLDVEALAALLATADNGCPNCTGDLAEEMAVIDPAHDWIALVRAARQRRFSGT